MTPEEKKAMWNAVHQLRGDNWSRLSKMLDQVNDYECKPPEVYCRPTASSQTERLPGRPELGHILVIREEFLELSKRLDKLEAQNGKP